MDNGASSYHRFRDTGDEQAFDELITAYIDGLILYLTRIVGNIRIAEELAEDTFVILGTKKPVFKGNSSFKTWLYAIGRSTAYDWLRKNAKHRRVSLDDLPEQVSEQDAVEEAYLRKEQQTAVRTAMRALPPVYQQVLWLIYFEGFSTKDTAVIMKKTVRSIESLLSRAREALKSQLETEGFHYEEP